jgi:hypothetical protein
LLKTWFEDVEKTILGSKAGANKAALPRVKNSKVFDY